jgi:hypothetical protein
MKAKILGLFISAFVVGCADTGGRSVFDEPDATLVEPDAGPEEEPVDDAVKCDGAMLQAKLNFAYCRMQQYQLTGLYCEPSDCNNILCETLSGDVWYNIEYSTTSFGSFGRTVGTLKGYFYATPLQERVSINSLWLALYIDTVHGSQHVCSLTSRQIR